MSTEKIWLKKEQAAEYLGIAIRTFDDKVKKGILPKPSTMLGWQNPRWNKMDIDATMNGENTQSQPTT